MKDTSKINKWINIDFNYFNLSMYIRNKIMNITFLYMVLVNSILLLLINKVNAIFFLLLQIINIILVKKWIYLQII